MDWNNQLSGNPWLENDTFWKTHFGHFWGILFWEAAVLTSIPSVLIVLGEKKA